MAGAMDVPEDRNLSEHTGWTRAHWLAQADYLLDSLKPFASPSSARFELPGRPSASGVDSDALEGFARTFLLAAWRIVADRGQGPVAEDLIARYSSGLAAGADAAHPEAWPRIPQGRPGQPMVEAASIALGLHYTREWLWDRLDARAQGLVADWLGEFIGNPTWPNNWMLFQTVTEEFLSSIGARYEESEILRGLDATEEWYVGDGWYTDGAGRNFDYYIGWAMHLYPLVWTQMAEGGVRGERALAAREVYRDRLRQFLERYFDFFGSDGAPIYQGRSLTYRFAAAAPIWVGEMFDCSPYDAGLSRRAASGVMKHFAEHGAPDARGLLTPGWHEPFLPMVQNYSGPASPYWASKGFIGLMLPADHRVWTALESPLPVEVGNFDSFIAPVGWALSGTKDDGVVRLLNHGSDKAWHHTPPFDPRTDVFYSPLAFSTVTAPDTAPEAWAKRVGNHVALIAPDGRVSSRAVIEPGTAADGYISSEHVPGFETEPGGAVIPIEGARISARVSVKDGVETREHSVTAPAGWTVREGGYPVAGPEEPLRGENEKLPGAFAVNDLGVMSRIEGLGTWTAAGVDTELGANALGAFSATPYLTAEHPGGTVSYLSKVMVYRLPDDGADDGSDDGIDDGDGVAE
ncbi:DUF2264 domain-containing protein [Catenulispora rubra]|uniref:DUF2264 domain-containing protein n=1 Tax=Catenulispora rubra TaxID=280293 RepID=UPI0018924DF1|nr:DUF2264 domain-containing protein [Catenulispora rubra]